MLNPIMNNFTIEFGNKFYGENLVKKYDDFLFHKNNPIKNIRDHIHESLNSLSIPGLNLAVTEINGLKDFGSASDARPLTTNLVFPKNQTLLDTFEVNKLDINCDNTLINWSYFYEFFRGNTIRGRTGEDGEKLDLTDFGINVIVRDSADIPILMFDFNKCYSASLPPLEFAYGSTFNESKTIDIGFWFNEMNVHLLIPGFKKINIQHGR